VVVVVVAVAVVVVDEGPHPRPVYWQHQLVFAGDHPSSQLSKPA